MKPPVRLSEFPFVVFRVGCGICNRNGSYRLARLSARFGPEAVIDDVLAALSADCPWRDRPDRKVGGKRWEGCGAHCQDLREGGPPPDLPPGLMKLRVVSGGKT